MKLIQKVTPISIRKLKKFYILKTHIDAYIHKCSNNCLIIRNFNDVYDKMVDLPNLYISKKVIGKIESRLYTNNKPGFLYNKIFIRQQFTDVQVMIDDIPASYIPQISLLEDMFTIYTVFETYNDFLKWKLSI